MRVNQQAAYVLHTRPYSESSLIVEIFSATYGRFVVLAKGARRVKSRVRGLLQPFQPLMVSWSGKGEMPTLTQVELNGRYQWLDYKSRVCGFYANELMMKMLQRRDPHQQLFQDYDVLMQCLSVNSKRELALRRFEKALLQETGYALILDHETEKQQPLLDDRLYRYIPESGPVYDPRGIKDSPLVVLGIVLNSIDSDDYTDDWIMHDAKQFMRRILQIMMGNKPLRSRDLLYHSIK